MSAIESRFLPYIGIVVRKQRDGYLSWWWWWWLEGRECNSGRGVLKAGGGQPPRTIDTASRSGQQSPRVTTMSIPQSDVSRPSALPTASLLQSRTSAAARLAQSQAQNSAQYLDDIEEEWNKKVDTEIETLVDGMVDIVSLASVSCPNASNFTV